MTALAWWHALLGPWGVSPIPNSLGLEGYPCAVLIDANGRLASRALYSSSIRVTVRNAMANLAEPGAPVVR